jgi:hypothetical protein
MSQFAHSTIFAPPLACLLAVVLILQCGCERTPAPPATDSPASPAAPPAATSDGASATSESATNGEDSASISGGTDAAPDEVAEQPAPEADSSVVVAAATPGSSAEAIEIVFEDIQLPIQADMVFRPFMLTPRVKELDGQRVRIHGYMLPDSKTKGIRQFVLLKNTECKFGPGGQADHLINVLMVDGVTARFRDDPISVEGVLKVNPFQGPDGNTWSIYDLACDRVETYRPRR